MLETLQIDDRIIVNQLTPALYPIERGDVVVFKDPGGWLGPNVEEPTDPVVVAVRLQVPDVTMVMVPVELPTVHTEVVSDSYTTGSEPALVAGVTTEAVAPFARFRVDEEYVQPERACDD